MNKSFSSCGFLPRDIILGLTSRCNFHCRTCNPHRNDHQKNSVDQVGYSDMSDEVFYKLEELFRQATTVTLGGVGEPTISCDFIKRIAWLRQVNPKVQIIVFTNGSILSSTKIIEKFTDAINYMHVSFNGLKNYEQVMVGGKLATTLKNLELLREVRSRTGKPQRLELGVVLMRSNLEDLVAITRLAHELKFDRIAFKDLWVFDANLKSESLRHDECLAMKIKQQVEEAQKIGIPIRCEPWPELSTSIFRPGHFVKCSTQALRSGHLSLNTDMVNYWSSFITDKLKTHLGFNRPWEKHPAFRSKPSCSFPWDMVQIDELGDVLLCCQGMSKIGNIKEKSFNEVWFGEEAENYRSGMLSGQFYGACNYCKVIKSGCHSFVREEIRPR